jgi:hypothetical protein
VAQPAGPLQDVRHDAQAAAAFTKKGNMMDPRLNDPEEQKRIARALTSSNPIDRLTAHNLLNRNGVDVEKASAEAKRWKAGQPLMFLRPQSGPIASRPGMTAREATRLALALAGDGGPAARLEAQYFVERHNISVDEVRAHARQVVSQHESGRR